MSNGSRTTRRGISYASIRRDGDNLFESYRRRPPTRVAANRRGPRRPGSYRNRTQLHQPQDHHGPQNTCDNPHPHAGGRLVAAAHPISSGQGTNSRNQPSAQVHGYHWGCSFVPLCRLEHQGAQNRYVLTRTRLTSADIPAGTPSSAFAWPPGKPRYERSNPHVRAV
jgi:hypothetical protein